MGDKKRHWLSPKESHILICVSRFQIFDDRQVESLRKGGRILYDCLQYIEHLVKPGVTTKALDDQAEAFICDRGAKPGFKGYKEYPASLCTSVNDECVHGLPGARILRDGDIVSLDCGVLLDHLYTDACITVPVGIGMPEAMRLIHTADRALAEALKVVRAGIRVGHLSATIQHIVEGEGYTVLKALTGHGLGTTLHQFPDVPNVGKSTNGPTIPAGTLLAIEPIISAGKSADVVESEDGWTIKTKDSALSAHSEHTVLITEEGGEILTGG